MTQQTLELHNRVHRTFSAQPVTYGVPWPEGAIKEVEELAVTDENGQAIPAALKCLNRWPDGSVQWSLVDLALDFEPSGARSVTIRKSDEASPAPENPVHTTLDGDIATIGNGLVELRVSSRAGELLRSWSTNGKPFVDQDGFDITFEDASGKQFSAKAGAKEIRIEHANPLRAIVRVDGKHAAADGEEMLDYFLRFQVTAGRPDVKVTYSFRNRELPTPGIEIRSLCARVASTAPPDAKRCFIAHNRTRFYLTTPLRVDEDPELVASDTGDLENYEETHEDFARGDCFARDPAVLHDPIEDKPWFLQDPKFRRQSAGGHRICWPYLGLVNDGGGILACFGSMTTLHPKSLTVKGSDLLFGIWPDWAGPLNITQGAGRSHVLHLGPIPPGASDLDIQTKYLSWELGGVTTHTAPESPIAIHPDTDQVRNCKVFQIHKLPRYEPDEHLLFERKVQHAWIGVSSGQLGATDQVNQWVSTGFWNYGDGGGAGHTSNNEEMHALVFLQNHLRTGNWGCAEYGLAAATHIMEVDHVAFSVEAIQNGGMVSHCLHHNDGAVYPSHMWFTELLCAYVLTGDEEYKEAALRMCENLLYWVDDEEGFQCISGDEREAGQPMINLTWCYEFNRDPRYLEACNKIAREYLMASAQKYGRMLDGKPPPMPVKIVSYGDYASWEGLYWLWEITKDEELKDFMLSQFEWRVTPEKSGVHGFHRTTDYNPAAYAYYLTGDREWLDRVARPLRAAFSAGNWPLGWVHSMYAIKLAFDLGIISDGDITVA